MKRFLLKILLFGVILAAADILIGFGLDAMRDRLHGQNEAARTRFISRRTEAPVVLLGSSRCYHHYVSPTIADILGMETVNAGRDGNGIILAYGYYLLLAQRYTPKVALLDIEPGFDIEEDDNTRYLKTLRPYYDDSQQLRDMYADIAPTERYKMLSHSYRYNSQLLTMAKGAMASSGDMTDYDILPPDENPNFDLMVRKDKPKERAYDPVKRRYLELFIAECRRHGTIPVLAFSPHFGRKDSRELEPVKEIARRHGVTVLDHYADTTFVDHREYFNDPYHLNSLGAGAYSRVIASELRSILDTIR